MMRFIKSVVKYVIVPAAIIGAGYVLGYHKGKSAYEQTSEQKTYTPEYSKDGKSLDDLVKKIK
jgi:hypothetical protein